MKYRLRAIGRSLFRGVVWACVFAGCWRAPVPWLHQHHASCRDSAAHRRNVLTARRQHRTQSCNGYDYDAALSEHIEFFHHGDFRHKGTGWHLHFVYLQDILRGGGCPLPHHEDDPLPDAAQPLLCASENSRFTCEVWVTELPAGADECVDILPVYTFPETGLCGRRIFRNPLSSFAAARTLLPLLCVARC